MTENRPFFSVQVAAYNVERYLKDSIGSVLSQSEQDFEILLVDDCSTDLTGSICDELAEMHSGKIHVFHNEKNKGLLASRRIAYRAASGEWLVSVDADDILAPGALALLKQAIKSHPCDLVLYNLLCRRVDGVEEEFSLSLEDGVVYRGEQKKQVYQLRYQGDRLNSMCTKAFRRAIWDAEADYSDWEALAVGEDIFQSYPLLDAADGILYLNRVLYYYNKREDSLTTGQQNNWYAKKKILWQRDDEYFSKWDMGKETFQTMLCGRLKEVVVFVDTLFRQRPTCAVWRKELDTISSDGLLKQWYRAILKGRIKTRYRVYSYCLIHRRFGLLRTVAWICQALMRIT